MTLPPDASRAAACCAHAPPATPAATGSRRRRLWELPDESHCPVVGVCLPLPTLRRLTAKVIGAPALGDYELHSCVVRECGRRSRLTEALQRELDTRCAAALRRFAAARSTDALALLWRDALRHGDIAQPLWAVLTHPRCDAGLSVQVCRDVHMLQHQAGAMARADLHTLRDLQGRHDALERELAAERERTASLRAQGVAERDGLAAQLMRTRADAIAKDSEIAALRGELASLHEAARELPQRRALAQRAALLVQRQLELQRDNAALREQLRAAQAAAALPSPMPAAVGDPSQSTPPPPLPVQLERRVVLCVGGRGGDVPRYRDCIERAGGRFLHHDGGVDDNPKLLDASLAAADLVICQTGCVSHNAYWLVKDHCKRTGKRCVFVERPSVAGLARGLGLAPADAAGR